MYYRLTKTYDPQKNCCSCSPCLLRRPTKFYRGTRLNNSYTLLGVCGMCLKSMALDSTFEWKEISEEELEVDIIMSE